MTNFPNFPRPVRGGFDQHDPATSVIQRTIVLQYNPDTLARTLQVPGPGEGADRSEALRGKAPPVETIKVEAEMAVMQPSWWDNQSAQAAVWKGLGWEIASADELRAGQVTFRRLSGT